jgi:hypothetical protein
VVPLSRLWCRLLRSPGLQLHGLLHRRGANPLKLPIKGGVGREARSEWPSYLTGMKLIFRTTGDGQRLSVRELARRAGMSEEGVRLIMTGKRRPSLESGRVPGGYWSTARG